MPSVLVAPVVESTGLTFSLLAVGEFWRASCTRGSLASAEGVAAMLEAGLAAMGEPADMGLATESTGAAPVWGEETAEGGPGDAPPRLLCRGDRGLCAPLTTEDQVPPEGLLRAGGGGVAASPGALWDRKSPLREEGTRCVRGVRWDLGDILGGPALRG